MTDKQMTETEIMKALECCYNAKCSECPYEIRCIKIMVKDALALLNSKNAEIDRLTAIEESHREQNGELRKEVERLTINMNAFGLGMKRESERADTARSEAIKEVLEKTYHYILDKKCGNDFTTEDLWDIAKEMGVEL